MVLYLRNKRNKDIAEVEINVKTDRDDGSKYVELSCAIDIKGYSKLLLETPVENQKHLIAEFDNFSELRGWMWEVYFMKKKNTPDELDGVIAEVKAMLKSLATKYELCTVED